MKKYLNVEPNLYPGISSTLYTIFKTLLDSNVNVLSILLQPLLSKMDLLIFLVCYSVRFLYQGCASF